MFNLLIGICWLIFTLVWIVFSLQAKKNKQESNQRYSSSVRLIFTTIVITLLFNIKGLQHLIDYPIFPVNDLVQSIGVFICAVGIIFAIWARTHLGKNWGMPMSVKEKPELVMTGPYYLIRHPIYTGIAIAAFGSMVTVGFMWLVWFILLFTYFIYSAKKEEKVMLQQFPKEYADYMKRTKMLIPFIF